MTKIIILSVVAGTLSGYFFLPEFFINISETLMIVGLSILLFFVGLDIGLEGTAVQKLKSVGWRIFVFPIASIVGTLVFTAIAGFILPITIREAMAVGAGLGWYTYAPIVLMEYSAELSAMSFMHNVMRELFAILLLPFVAKWIGYVEVTSLPGAGAMDVFLPLVEKATDKNIVIYSFVMGVVLSIAVPILVPIVAGL